MEEDERWFVVMFIALQTIKEIATWNCLAVNYWAADSDKAFICIASLYFLTTIVLSFDGAKSSNKSGLLKSLGKTSTD